MDISKCDTIDNRQYPLIYSIIDGEFTFVCATHKLMPCMEEIRQACGVCKGTLIRTNECGLCYGKGFFYLNESRFPSSPSVTKN